MGPLLPYPTPHTQLQLHTPGPSVLWTVEDLERRRPDGYKSLAAPLLRGECHMALPTGKALGVEERIYRWVGDHQGPGLPRHTW